MTDNRERRPWLPDLAAATKVWRNFAKNPKTVYRGRYKHIANSVTVD